MPEPLRLEDLKPFEDKFPCYCVRCDKRIWEGYTDDEDNVILCPDCYRKLLEEI